MFSFLGISYAVTHPVLSFFLILPACFATGAGSLVALAYATFVGFLHDYDFLRAYTPMSHERRNLYECVRAHVRGEGDGVCFGGPAAVDVEWEFRRARELDFNFDREVTWR